MKTVDLGNDVLAIFGLHRETGITSCTIQKDGTNVGNGKAVTGKNDMFCRKIGRELAFTRAIEDSNGSLSKGERAQAWHIIRDIKNFKFK